MNISHWLSDVTTLGPGQRLGLWVQGCKRKCKGCVSPELQSGSGLNYPIETLIQVLNNQIVKNHLVGVTISGGEPFEQAKELFELCAALDSNDILVYTGYTYEEIIKRFGSEIKKSNIGVLITGPYIEELNDDLPLRGSSNQEMVFLNKTLESDYQLYLKSHKREQQFFLFDGEIYMAGIPNAGNAKTISEIINNILEEE